VVRPPGCRVVFEVILSRFLDCEVDESGLVWARNNDVRGHTDAL